MTPPDEHAEEIAVQEELLRSVDYLRDLDRVDIARLIGSSEDVHFAAGDVIVLEGAVADSLYLLAKGSVTVLVAVDGADQPVASISAPATFGDFGMLLPRRTATVRAKSEVQAWRIRRDVFERLLRERPGLGLAMARALATTIDRRERAQVGATPPAPVMQPMLAAPRLRPSGLPRWAAIGIAVAVPAVLWFLPPPGGLGQTGWHIALVVLGAALGWLLEPVPDFAVGLAMVAAWGALGLAPPSVGFLGFASSAWITAVAALAISAAMAGSGLLFRTALLLLRLFPPTHRGQVAALFLGGVALTPLVPTIFGRVATVAPVAREVSQSLGYPARSRGSLAIAFAGILGNTLVAPVFFTGVVTNFLVIGLLPTADQARFTWLGWLLAAAPAGVVLVTGSLAMLFLMDPRAAHPTSRTVRRSQEHSLGRMSRQEWASLSALVVFVIGLLALQLITVDLGVVSLVALLVAVLTGALDRQVFRSGIDWATLVLFGVLLGAGNVLRLGGVDHWIADSMLPMSRSLADPAVLVVLLAVLVVVVRLVLPMVPAGFLLLITLVPAASTLGLNGWVVGFACSVMTLTWILPRQYEVLRMARELTGGEMFDDRQALLVGASATGIALLAILVSLPYWHAIGLM